QREYLWQWCSRCCFFNNFIVANQSVGGASLCQETGVRRLYGGCWWVREVTCPKSQRAGFQLAALDDRAAPECPPGPASSLFASRRSCRYTTSERRRVRQRIASFWLLPSDRFRR